MTINELAIAASDEEMSYGGGLMRIAPAGTPLASDISALTHDILWCWPVAEEADDSGTPIPKRLICGPDDSWCDDCTVKNCPKGPPPPFYTPLAPDPGAGDDETNRLAVLKSNATYPAARIALRPFTDGLPLPGPVCVLDLGGPITSLEATKAPVWDWVKGMGRDVVVHVYNVVDPRALPTPALGYTPHPLHNKVIAIPVIPWVPPPPLGPL